MTLHTAEIHQPTNLWQPAWPDAVRGLIVASVPVAVATDGLIGFALMFLVLGGSMLPLALTAHRVFDAALCLTMLGSAWAALADGYERVPWLDIVVHATLTGLITALVALLVHRTQVLSPMLTPWAQQAALGTSAFAAALALATMWEIGEWLGHTFLDSRIQVGHVDTMTDLVAGSLGAAVAAVVAATALTHGHRTAR